MKILLLANTDWYLYNFRRDLAQELQRKGYDLVLVSPPGEYVPRLSALGFRWLPLAMERSGMNPFKELRTILRLFRLYRVEKPDLVHHFTVKCVLYGSLAGRWSGVASVVNSVPGLGYTFMEGRLPRRALRGLILAFYRLVLGRTWVIFQNPEDRQIFIERRLVDHQKTTLVRGSGIDLQRFSPTLEKDGTPTVVLPARMLWDKGVGEFVSAAGLLKSSGVKARFILVGDSDPGNPAAVPARQLQDWQESGVIEWWGWQEDMPAVYSQAHIVCLPSYREGVPRTLLEAAACGRPIIASDVPGCREVVKHGINGLLVAARDVNGLAHAIEQLIQDGPLRMKMGAESRKIAQAEFSVDLINSQILTVYKACNSKKVE